MPPHAVSCVTRGATGAGYGREVTNATPAAAPPACSERVVGVNHVGLSVLDLEAAVETLTAQRFSHISGFAWTSGAADVDAALGLSGSAAEVAVLQGANAYLEVFAYSAPVPRPAEDSGVQAEWVDTAAGPWLRSVRWPAADAAAAEAWWSALTPQVGVQPLGAAAPGAGPARRRMCDLGGNHVCLDVVGIDAVFADLVERGATYGRAPAPMPGGLASVGYLWDPWGNAFELLESHDERATLWRGRLGGAVGPVPAGDGAPPAGSAPPGGRVGG